MTSSFILEGSPVQNMPADIKPGIDKKGLPSYNVEAHDNSFAPKKDHSDLLLFCFGFLCGVTWFIGAFRPLCRRPRFPRRRNFYGWLANLVGSVLLIVIIIVVATVVTKQHESIDDGSESSNGATTSTPTSNAKCCAVVCPDPGYSNSGAKCCAANCRYSTSAGVTDCYCSGGQLWGDSCDTTC